MIPLRDVIPSRTMPCVTVAIIALNTLAFFVELSLRVPDRSRFIEVYGVVPASVGSLSLLTSMFLHGSWRHFLGNMLYLWIFGDNVEDRVGHGRFVVFYVMCGLAAAIVQIASNPDSVVPMVGASGAIAGVMGAYFVLFPRSRVLALLPLFIVWELIEVPAIFFLGFWFLMQLLSGIGSVGAAQDIAGIAFWAHIAGFVTGAIASSSSAGRSVSDSNGGDDASAWGLVLRASSVPSS